jgi:hypothetical protein
MLPPEEQASHSAGTADPLLRLSRYKAISGTTGDPTEWESPGKGVKVGLLWICDSCIFGPVGVYYDYVFGGRTMNKRSITLFMLPLMLMAALLVPQKVDARGSDRMTKMVFPNPFTESTTFDLTMPKSAQIRIAVFDMLGQHVKTLYEGTHPEGNYKIPWDGKDLNGNPVPPGVYVCVLYSENVAVKSVKVIKAQT